MVTNNLSEAEFIHKCEEIRAEFEEGIAKHDKRMKWYKWSERLSSLGGLMLLGLLIYCLFGGK